jgi:hypothetical protein
MPAEPGSLAYELFDGHLDGFCDEDQVGESRVAFPAFVTLDAAALEADAVRKLVL